MQLVNVRTNIAIQEDPGLQLHQGSVPPAYSFTALPQEVSWRAMSKYSGLGDGDMIINAGRNGFRDFRK